MILSVFVFLGIIHLALMLRTDLKYMKVDDRHNWFMMGVVSFIFLTNYPGTLIFIALSIISFIMAFALNKYSAFSDVKMGSWAIIGFGIMNLVWAAIYMSWVLILRLMYIIPMKRTKTKKLPGTPLFLGAFVLTAACAFYLDFVVYGIS